MITVYMKHYSKDNKLKNKTCVPDSGGIQMSDEGVQGGGFEQWTNKASEIRPHSSEGQPEVHALG